MARRLFARPGDLVYLSERRLLSTAVQLGLSTGSLRPELDLEGTGTISAGVPSIAKVSVNATAQGTREDPGKRDRLLLRQLRRIERRLQKEGLPNLETDKDDVYDGSWFRFHRRLRFGVGADDSNHSVRALVAVDEHPVERGLSIPGLLMNGSPTHVRPPYLTDALLEDPGMRSGSGTGRLFVWLERVRQKLEEDPGADPSAIGEPALQSDRPPRHTQTAIDMYGLFARDAWLSTPRFPQLLNGAPCEGLAQASFVAVNDEMALVMASPLYIRVRRL
jgi:hypothetical protein